ncbi:astacin-like [Cimex lectularius]|uniref:Metalloendopeptidase n=1 Tax=Cimex lectularius TaxID=79782 RepID=A0A8I6RMU6_CIMLE|nr:astacin-like [Cimex lectularius]
MHMHRSFVVILIGASLVAGRPGFFSNFISDSGEDDEDLGIMKYLNGFGDNLWKGPDNKTGEAVSRWLPSHKNNPEELGAYAEGDILFPSPKSRNGLKAKSARWPKGVIPYVFGASFNAKDRATIDAAMKEYHKLTCIRFVPRTKEADYLLITSENTGCWSSVGRVGGAQELNLQSPGCLVQKGTVMHEMMHAIGFLHEQNRWERDNFVTIHFENIEPGRKNNFDKAQQSQTDDLGIPYDYSSVMHYSATAFSVNEKPTIVPKKTGVKLGQRESVSHQDVQKIRRMYKCKKH